MILNSLVEYRPALLNVLAYMSLKSPDTSSNCLWQGYEHDAEITLKGEDCEQNMEVLASSLAVVGAGLQVSKTTKSCYSNYRDAEKQMLHAQNQGNQLRQNQLQLNKLPESTKKRIGPALASLNDVNAALPEIPHRQRKRDRMKWVIGGKSEFESEISKSDRTESLLNSNLLLSVNQAV